jgi:hypothetical protein
MHRLNGGANPAPPSSITLQARGETEGGRCTAIGKTSRDPHASRPVTAGHGTFHYAANLIVPCPELKDSKRKERTCRSFACERGAFLYAHDPRKIPGQIFGERHVGRKLYHRGTGYNGSCVSTTDLNHRCGLRDDTATIATTTACSTRGAGQTSNQECRAEGARVAQGCLQSNQGNSPYVIAVRQFLNNSHCRFAGQSSA